MKSFLRKFLVTVSLLSIITIQVEAKTLTPPNVQLLGDANGLVHIPEDDLFLHYQNMLPGDSVKRTLEIKNTYEYPYELFLRAERVSKKEEYDLLNKLDLTITYKDKVIYAGPTSGEYELTDDISLGVFEPGQEETLIAEVKLDGPSTGNEYKNKYAQVDWIFTAIRSEDINPDGGTDDTNPPTDTNPDGGTDDTNPPTDTNPDGGSDDTKPPTDTNPDEDTEDIVPPTDIKPDGDNNDYIDVPKTGDEGTFLYVILGGISILLIMMTNRKKTTDKNNI